MNGGLCITPGLCICPPGFYGINCDKGNGSETPGLVAILCVSMLILL